jgi:hypothetical protein
VPAQTIFAVELFWKDFEGYILPGEVSDLSGCCPDKLPWSGGLGCTHCGHPRHVSDTVGPTACGCHGGTWKGDMPWCLHYNNDSTWASCVPGGYVWCCSSAHSRRTRRHVTLLTIELPVGRTRSCTCSTHNSKSSRQAVLTWQVWVAAATGFPCSDIQCTSG